MQKSTFLAAFCLALTAAPIAAHELSGHSHVTNKANVVTVSCYRGPWEQVYWDRAKPEFYDSLIRIGYTPERAQALADRLCRDQSLVKNPEAMRREALRLISITPRS